MSSSYDYSATPASAQPKQQPQPKPIANAYDISYIPQPLRPASLMGTRHSNADSSVRRNHHAEDYRNDGTGVRHQQATCNTNSYESMSPYAHTQSSAVYSSLLGTVQSQSAPRFPLSVQPQPTCELSQWITTTTTNSPVQQLQHLNQQLQQPHYTSAQTQYPGQPGSMSSASSSFPSTTSPTSASDSYDYASSASPDIYNSPSYQHLSYHHAAPSSLPASSVLNPDSIGSGWPSSAPATSSGMDLYTQMILNFSPPHSSPHRHPSTLNNVAPSPLESTNFYSGFAGLGLQSQASPQLPQQHDDNTGVSPRDVMASTTVVDADDFGTSWGSGGSPMGDFPVVNGASGGAGMGFSPEYTRYAFSGGDDLDLSGSFAGRNNGSAGQMMTTTYQDPFASSPPSDFINHDQQDQVQQTQFPVDLEDNMEASMATLRALPTNTKATGGGRLGLQLLDTHGHAARHRDDTVTSRNVAGLWDGPASAPVESAMHQHFGRRQMVGDRRPSLHAAFSDILPKSESPLLASVPLTAGGEDIEAEEDDEEEDEEDDADDDDDYVEERGLTHHQHHSNASGYRMSARRHSHNVPRPTKPKRLSPYSRPRPSNTSTTTTTSTSRGAADKKAGGEKKAKAVKWESTKPKYWVPEGFDPWWDQKSRGRGVETISSSLSSSLSASYDQDDVVVGERDYLPDDWRELVRGQGNPARPFVCPAVNCGKTFQRSEHAKRHAGSLHTPDAVKVPCPYPGCEHKSTRGDNLKQHMDSHRRKKGGAGSFSAGVDMEDKDRTVRSRKGSGVGASGSRPRRVRSMAAVKNEDE
ncbi:zf-C2H2 Zinc finger, C2H2 type [Tulasnella sp. JGI-2019a]|nr:zf-C2H2 Zinc finger, C2H2 type [Tulasnella sp. JGI-2019a]